MDDQFRQKLRSVFDVCDVLNEGYITTDHFRGLAIEHFGADSEDENINSIIQILDPEGKGQINFDDFCSGVQQIIDLHPPSSPTAVNFPEIVTPTTETLIDFDEPQNTENHEVTSEASAYTYNEYDTNTDEDGANLLIDFSVPSATSAEPKNSTFNSHSHIYCTDEENFEDFGEVDDLDSDASDTRHNSQNCDSCQRNRSRKGVNSHSKHHRRNSGVGRRLSAPLQQSYIRSRSPAPDEVLDDIDGIFSQLNGRIQFLENQVVSLSEDKKGSEAQKLRIKDENSILMESIVERIHTLEDQLKDVESKADTKLSEEKSKFKELMSRNDMEKSIQLDNFNQSMDKRCQSLEAENNVLRQESLKLKSDVERLRLERNNAEERLSESQDDYNKLTAEHEDFIRKAEKERESAGQLLDELSKELEELRKYKIDCEHNNRPRSDSHLELPGRYHALQEEVSHLKEENKSLHDMNEDLSAQLLNQCLAEGKSLVQDKESSLAAELSHLTKEELMAKLKEQTDTNIRLKSYVDRMLIRIMEMNPALLEV